MPTKCDHFVDQLLRIYIQALCATSTVYAYHSKITATIDEYWSDDHSGGGSSEVGMPFYSDCFARYKMFPLISLTLQPNPHQCLQNCFGPYYEFVRKFHNQIYNNLTILCVFETKLLITVLALTPFSF